MTLTSKALCFKSKFITAELARLFSQSDSEEEFEGFSEDEEEVDRRSYNKQKPKMVELEDDSDVDTGFYSDGEDAPPPKRRSLLVALRFPMKRPSTPKQEPRKKNIKADKVSPPSQRPRRRVRQKEEEVEEKEKEEEKEEEEKEEEEEEEGMSQSLKNHYRNIEENKAMLAKLFADLRTMADLTANTPSKKKRTQEKVTPRKRKAEEMGSERRNPSRKARPRENFAVEEKSEPVIRKGPRTVDIRRLVEVDEEHVGERRKMRKSGSRRSQYVVKSVDEITEEDLDNIAYRSKDKIWDKENGSSCHQCRQKTLDTKTVCRSGFCVGAKGQFCGPCLKNRYGEDVRTVLLDPIWSCPICRGMCNCSLCRKKEGRCATGILVGLARYNGHDNVHEYLESIQKELH